MSDTSSNSSPRHTWGDTQGVWDGTKYLSDESFSSASEASPTREPKPYTDRFAGHPLFEEKADSYASLASGGHLNVRYVGRPQSTTPTPGDGLSSTNSSPVRDFGSPGSTTSNHNARERSYNDLSLVDSTMFTDYSVRDVTQAESIQDQSHVSVLSSGQINLKYVGREATKSPVPHITSPLSKMTSSVTSVTRTYTSNVTANGTPEDKERLSVEKLEAQLRAKDVVLAEERAMNEATTAALRTKVNILELQTGAKPQATAEKSGATEMQLYMSQDARQKLAAKLNTTVAESKERFERYQSETSKVISTLTAQVEDKDRQIQKLEKELSTQTSVTSLSGEHTQLLSERERTIATLIAQNSEFQSKITAQQRTIQSLEEQLESSRKDITTLKTNMDTEKQTMDGRMRDLQILQQRESSLAISSSVHVEDHVKHLAELVERQRKQLDDLQRSNNKDELLKLRVDYHQLLENYNEAQHTITKLNQSISENRRQSQIFRDGQESSLKQKMKDLEAEIQRLTSQLELKGSEYENFVKSSVERTSVLEKEHIFAMDALRLQHADEIKNLQDRLRITTETHNTALTQLTSQIEDTKGRLEAQPDNSYISLKVQYEQERKENDELVHGLREEIENLKRYLRQEKADSELRMAEIQLHVNERDVVIAELEARLKYVSAAADQQIAHLVQDLERIHYNAEQDATQHSHLQMEASMKISQLTRQLEAAQNERQALEENLHTTISKLESESKSQRGRQEEVIAALRNELRSLTSKHRDEVRALEATLHKVQAEADDLRHESEQRLFQMQLELHQSVAATSVRTPQKSPSPISRTEENVVAIEESTSDPTTSINSTTTNISVAISKETEAHIAEVRKRNSELAKEVAQLRAENSFLRSQIDVANSSRNELLEQVQAEAARVKQELLDQLRAAEAALQEARESASREITELKSVVMKLTSDAKLAEVDFSSQLSEAHGKIKQLESELQREKTDAHNTLMAEQSKWENERRGLTITINDLEKEVGDLKSEKQHLTSQLTNVREECNISITTLSTQLQEFTAQYNVAKSEHNERLAELRNTLREKEELAAREQAEHANQVRDLKVELTSQQEVAKQAVQQAEHLKMTMDTRIHQLETQQEEAKMQYSVQVQKLELRVEETKKEAVDAQGAQHIVNDEVAQLRYKLKVLEEDRLRSITELNEKIDITVKAADTADQEHSTLILNLKAELESRKVEREEFRLAMQQHEAELQKKIWEQQERFNAAAVEYEKEINDLIQRNRDLEGNIVSQKTEHTQVVNQLQTFIQVNASKETSQSDEVARLQRALQESHELIQKLEFEVANERKSHLALGNDLNHRLQSTELRMSTITEQRDNTVTELKIQIDSLRQSLSEKDNKIIELETQLQVLLADLRQAMTEQESILNNAAMEKKKLMEELSHCRAEKDAAVSGLSTKILQLEALLGEREGISAETIEQLKAMLRQRDEQLERNEEAKEKLLLELAANVKAHQQVVSSHEGRIHGYTTQIHEMQTAMDNIRLHNQQRVEQYVEEIRKLKDIQADLQVQMEKSRTEIDLSQKLASAKTSHDDSEITVLRTQINETKSYYINQLQIKDAQHADAVSELAARVEHLKVELSNTQQNRDIVVRKLEGLWRTSQEHLKEVQELHDRKLRELKAQTQDELQVLRKALNNLKNKSPQKQHTSSVIVSTPSATQVSNIVDRSYSPSALTSSHQQVSKVVTRRTTEKTGYSSGTVTSG